MMKKIRMPALCLAAACLALFGTQMVYAVFGNIIWEGVRFTTVAIVGRP